MRVWLCTLLALATHGCARLAVEATHGQKGGLPHVQGVGLWTVEIFGEVFPPKKKLVRCCTNEHHHRTQPAPKGLSQEKKNCVQLRTVEMEAARLRTLMARLGLTLGRL